MNNQIDETLLTESIDESNVSEKEKKFKLYVKELNSRMKDLTIDEKREFGIRINSFREKFKAKIDDVKSKVGAKKESCNLLDLTLSKPLPKYGAMHPLNRIYKQFETYYVNNGFNIINGPEIELDKYNCEMLNMPEHHPARSMQDTFYIEYPNKLLRSHTSAMQIRYMLTHKPPIKIICPGIVYRVDELDPQHTPMFFQMEGLVVGKDISLANLKSSLIDCIQYIYGLQTNVRFVPCYYPYTEPSAAVDMSCPVCNGEGCRTCKQSGWIRVCGCGMVHPNVFKNVGYSDDVQGFAFGYGLSRLPQIKYGLPELRILHDNNIKVYKKIK